MEALESLDECLLCDVHRLFAIRDHPVRDPEHLVLVPEHKRLECALVSVATISDQAGVLSSSRESLLLGMPVLILRPIGGDCLFFHTLGAPTWIQASSTFYEGGVDA